MSKFEFKIVLALLFASVTPLVVSALLADRMVGDAFHIASTPNLTGHLQQAAGVYRLFFETRKALHNNELAGLSAENELALALKENNIEAVSKVLHDFVEHNKYALAVKILDGAGNLIAHAEKIPRPPRLRTLALSTRLVNGMSLDATFGMPEQYLEELERLEEDIQLSQDLETAKGSIQKVFTWTFVGILGVVILGSAGIGIFFSRRVTKRINALVQATRRVAADDLDFTLDPRGTDEVGDLTREFNRMVKELKESRSRIQYLERIGAWQGMARRLAHEIKNPLTPIQLAMEEVVSKYEGDDSKFRKLLDTALEVVHEEIDVLRSLVKEFSRFARIPLVKPEKTDLKSFIQDVAKSYSFDDSVDLKLRVKHAPGELLLDKVMMRMVIENLVVNAAQASNGKARVTITIDVDERSGRAVLDVADRGTGVPDENKWRIFEPYFTSKPHGTGLGLAIAKKVILDHSGQIEVHDNPGGGAVFRILLPREHA
ncbi:MAG: HAMP domain-containing protein [Deltaproteobacteria bacterium]|nr:HAMP domain-containing protein [Deltaproteobacteria bacterium]